MSIYLGIVIAFLVLIIIFLVYRLIDINISIRKLQEEIEFVLNNDTNHLITLPCGNRNIKRTAERMNMYLKKLRKEELIYKNGNRELQEIITNISHDLRTPLTSMKGYIDLLRNERLKSKRLEYMNVIEGRMDNLIELTGRLYDYSMCLDVGEKVEKESVCLNDVLEDILAYYYEVFKSKGIVPEIDMVKRKIYRNIDRNMFIRTLENVLSNIIKYSEGDVKIILLDNGKMVFKNKASRLDTTSVNRLFDRYYTIESGSKVSGIGLSIARQLVLLNGGVIVAKYQKGYLIVEICFWLEYGK